MMPGREEIEAAVLEYLEHFEFLHSAECLRAELEQKRIRGEEKVDERKKSVSVVGKILQSFDDGEEEVFSFLWRTKMAEKAKVTKVGRRLEFDVRLYMATFGFEKGQKRASEKMDAEFRMRSLKKFLDGPGSDLCEDPLCCSFYALPYCGDPQNHPTFQQLFTISWKQNIRQRLQGFAEMHLTERSRPVLCEWLEPESRAVDRFEEKNFEEGEDFQLKEVREEEKQDMHHSDSLRKFNKAVYATLLQTVELVEKLRSAESTVPDIFMNKLLQRVNEFGTMMDSGDLDEFKLDLSLFDEPSASPEQKFETVRSEDSFNEGHENDVVEDQYKELEAVPYTLEIPGLGKMKPRTGPMSPQSPHPNQDFQIEIETPVLPALDFALLKSDLAELAGRAALESMAEKQGCLILQALRWRLSRTASYAARTRIVEVFMRSDLLDIADGQKADEEKLIGLLVECMSKRVQEYALRLLNYLALNALGRKYLRGCKVFIIGKLLGELHNSNWEFLDDESGNRSRIVLCLLQRLSLDPIIVESIFNVGNTVQNGSIIEFLIQLVSNHQKRSVFENEHLAALLLNVCQCSAVGSEFDREASALAGLSWILSQQELNYLHLFASATIFSLLKSERVSEAISQQENEYFSSLWELCQEGSHLESDIKKQLFYMLDLINNGKIDQLVAESEEQEGKAEDFGDDIIPENDEDDLPEFRESNTPVSTLHGERLLVHAYLAENLSPSKSKERKSSDGQKSPVMHLVDSVLIPDEMQSKPRIIQ